MTAPNPFAGLPDPPFDPVRARAESSWWADKAVAAVRDGRTVAAVVYRLEASHKLAEIAAGGRLERDRDRALLDLALAGK